PRGQQPRQPGRHPGGGGFESEEDAARRVVRIVIRWIVGSERISCRLVLYFDQSAGQTSNQCVDRLVDVVSVVPMRKHLAVTSPCPTQIAVVGDHRLVIAPMHGFDWSPSRCLSPEASCALARWKS